MIHYYLGGDASKGYADFVILDANKQVVIENFQLDDIHDGHCQLYDIIELFFHNHPDCTLHAAVESTGGYENNWYRFFMDISSCFNVKFARLNPLGVSKNMEAGLKRNITDKVSAQSIAEYLITHAEKISYQQRDLWAPLKEQWTYIDLLNKQKVQLLNRLEKEIYKANLELLCYCKRGTPRWILKLVTQFPTAKHLAQAKLEQLVKIPYVSSGKAQKLVERAQTSVSSATNEEIAQRITSIVKKILEQEKEIAQQKKLLEKNVKIVPDKIQLLKTFKGIGTYSAVGLLILIGDVNRFKDAKKLACFFGLHPAWKKSGDGSWGYHMSKKGALVARQILYMITLSAIRWNPFIQEIYASNLKKGMTKMAAIGVCMHKILRIVYGMLKNNQAFDPAIDLRNREKQQFNSKSVSQNRSRRFQAHDPNAPISGRQAKKRKEQAQSQHENLATNDLKNSILDLNLVNFN
ncbi:MAG: transposase [bacterium]|nr:MAG: transposase [bacterium]